MGFLAKIFGKADTLIDETKMPVHIAIIPDGNGRWAKKRGMPRSVGHREGSKALKRIVQIVSQLEIKYMTVYAFSTENWNRPKGEVDALMGLLLEYLRNAERELEGSNIRIKVIGDIESLPQELQKEIRRVEGFTSVNTGLNLIFAINYGGKDEIVNAVRKIAGEVKSGRLKISDINKETIAANLYTSEIPDPDLIIRTSGEMRASNFLLWQAAYSEYFFPEVLWPDFGKQQLFQAISEYQKRNRRYGGL